MILKLRKRDYRAKVGILLVTLALIVVMIGCGTTGGTTPTKYNLTMAANPVGGGTATDLTGTSPYAAGTAVSIKAVANPGYKFVSWSAPAGTFGNATAAQTTFTMPAQNVTVTANFEVIPPTKYSLTMAVSPGGSGTATDLTNASPYTVGTVVNIAAVANPGYRFANWTAPAGVFGGASAANTTFTMPAQNVTVTANFVAVYNLSTAVNPGGSGTATDLTNASPYPAGTVVNIQAVAAAGYRFVNWSAPAGTFGNATAATTTFTMPAQAVTVTANFVPVYYDLTMAVNPVGGGTAADLTGASPYAAGTGVGIKAVANPGYRFVSWTAAAGTFGSATAATTTFSMPAQNATVTANFVAVYSLSMAANPEIGGTATDLTNASPYTTGTGVSIKAEANEGYRFVDWTASAGVFDDANAAETTFTMPGQNATVTANFATAYSLTMAVAPGGSGTATDLTGASPYTAGTVVSIQAVAAAGYQFANWTAPAGTFGSTTAATTTFTMPGQNATVTANFVAVYSLTMAVSPGGSGTTTDLTGASPYTAGTVVSIQAVAAAGYQFANWTAPAGTFGSTTAATTTFTIPAQNVTVTANFVAVYSLTMAVSPGGSGTATDLTNASPYTAGTVVSIQAVAAAGYRFVNWTAPAGTFDDANATETTFTMPAQNVTVTANFVAVYSLTMAVSPGSSGIATDLTNASPYTAGTVVSIQAVAAAGYRFVNWTAPAGTFDDATAATTTFTMPAQNVTVTANFVAVYSLTMAVSPGGSGTAADLTNASPYTAGTVVSIQAVAAALCQFVTWSAPAGTFGNTTATMTNFIMPAQNVTVTANFVRYQPIRTWYDLDAIRNNLADRYILMNDLDSTTAGYAELASPTANGGNGWQPIGHIEPGEWDIIYVDAFTGTFDGRGYEVRDLFIINGGWGVGLFGAVGGGVIENVKVLDANVTGGLFVGSLVGANHGSVISSCSSGNVTGGSEEVGGLVGFNQGGIYDSYSSASVANGDMSIGGLVGRNDGSISDSYATGSVSGSQMVGGLVGFNTYWDVSNCYATGTVSGGSSVGGLVGYNWAYVSHSYATGNVTGSEYIGGLVGMTSSSATVSNSYATGSVTGGDRVGGLTGQLDWDATVSNSYSTGSVSGDSNVGGLVGYNWPTATVSNSYSTGSVSGDSNVGGLVGWNGGTVSASFWDTETSGQATSAGGTGKNTMEMVDIDTFTGVGWNITAVGHSYDRNPTYIWNIVDGVTYPFLSWQAISAFADFAGGSGTEGDPYQIANWYQLDNVRNYLDSHFILVNNISSSTPGYTLLASSTANGGHGWQSIGTSDCRFSGTFDGRGHAIRDLFINRPSEDHVGLFCAALAGGVIENVKVLNADVTGSDGVGILVGATAGTVSNSCSSGSVSGSYYVGGLVGYNNPGGNVSNSYSTSSVDGDYYVGGLVGYNNYGTVDCYYYSTCSVHGNYESIGGLLGYNYHGTVSNSWAYGDVSGGSEVGGLVGHNYFGTVDSSYATGNVSGSGDEVGGLVGHNSGTLESCNATVTVTGNSDIGGLLGFNDYGNVSNCYADGDVTGSGSYIGGLVGENEGGSVNTCYATGNVTGTSSDWCTGGLVGWNSGTVSNSYATGNVSASDSEVGGLVGANTGNVTKSYATGNVIGYGNVGGLVGNNNAGTVSNSYATAGSVSGVNFVGGLVGYINPSATVDRCYSTGSVSGSSSVGGLVGWNNFGTVTHSGWDNETSGQSTSSGGIGKTTAQMYNITTFSSSWDIVAIDHDYHRNLAYIWNIVDGKTYPFLSCQSTGALYELTMAINTVGAGTATDLTGASPYPAGTVVDIEGIAAGAYYFIGWSAPAGTFGDPSIATTNFTMPAQNVTVTANFGYPPFW